MTAVAPSTLNAPWPGPFRLCLWVLVFATLTILKGALTTSTGSGMAFPDWPLSDGEVMPERSYRTLPGFFEHFHRLAAATTGLLALALALWLQFGRRGSALAKGVAWGGGLLILAQGVVGGVGVRLNLPTVTSVTHAVLAQLTFATFAWLAYLLSKRRESTPVCRTVPTGAGRRLAAVGAVALVVQTWIGGLARHTNSAHALWTHVGNAFVVFLLVAIAAAFAVGRMSEVPGIRSLCRALMTAVILQIALGFVALLARNPDGKRPENVESLGKAALVSAHVLLGAILTMLAVALFAHVHRATRPPEPADSA